MPGITLRMARPEDAGGMLAVYAPYVEHSTASWEYEGAVFGGIFRTAAGASGHGLSLAACGGGRRGTGYAYAGRFAARRGYDWDAEVTVYLSAAAHRRHAATALYTALLALLRRQGYVNCFALITHPNPASAAFHERMGFAEAARLPHAGYKDGRWLGLSYYQLTLQPLPAVPVPPVPLSALGAAETERSLRDAAALCRPAPEVL